ncbi:MAG: aminotransferase class III-fold pyridoxal phosphate-dependent enzyme [Gammaproteobacteria bacterium]|nr:aminotransferase class III-fold pyridoxal phosphate-dependent enzyme [Gammaproteobacteria bacterium]MCH9743574.1 aminotransferase class III-fold pyridoxal phosphate-dependent enzyme [Gammaproteobacteria bacterium]
MIISNIRSKTDQYMSSPIWYPCQKRVSQKPLKVVSAEGCFIELENGARLIDATSSWWCKSLGHQHPQLRQALLNQMQRFEHVMLADMSHDELEKLSYRLTGYFSTLDAVSYASDGACAVEMAMKMSLLVRSIQSQPDKNQFISLQGAYHGETLATLQVSDLNVYKKDYPSDLIHNTVIQDIPYVSGVDDTLWNNCDERWASIRKQLDSCCGAATAILVEPIVQAANGMRIISQDFLKRLRQWCDQNDVHLIVDEVFTGLGRTGRFFSCEYAQIEPDFMCLGKALTAGWLPMSAVLISNQLSFIKEKFIHSHTYAGNALAAAVANAHLDVLEKTDILNQVESLQRMMLSSMCKVSSQTGQLINVRSIGAMVAADVANGSKEFAQSVCDRARQLGALMRPLGETVYWLLPLNATAEVVEQLQSITLESIAF